MDEDQVKEKELSPMEWEEKILNMFRDNWTPNPKKLKKLALKFWPLAPTFIQKHFLTYIIESPRTTQYLLDAFHYVELYMQFTREFLAEGKHGMLVHNDVIYPIELKTNSKWLKEGVRWTPEQEHEIMQDVIPLWMEEHKVDKFQGKLVLFYELGFSGRFKMFNDYQDPGVLQGKVGMAQLLYRKRTKQGIHK